LPRERLVNAVLSRKFSPFDRSIDMHVSKVRKKLGDTDSDEHIKTVRGVGYIFCASAREVEGPGLNEFRANERGLIGQIFGPI